jgi:hypothetical protein
MLTNLKAISALSFVSITNAMDDIAGVVGDLWTLIKNPSMLIAGGEDSIEVLLRVAKNRIALNRAIREGPGPEPELTDRERWGSEWAEIHAKGWRQVEREMMAAKWSKSGQLFGSDNPLFSMEGRDTGEMFGPDPGRGGPGKVAKTKGSRFDRPDTGNLSRIGGLYFGADYNLRLMTLQQETKRLTERIAVSNEAIAQSVKE